MSKLEKGLPNSWKIVLAFFLGGAVSSIAEDPSDYLFFWISSKGPLSTTNQLVYWYYVPFLIYIGFFFLGLLMARARLFGPEAVLYLFIAVIIFSALLSVKLPQFASLAFEGSLLLATIISLGIVVGVQREVTHR